MVCTNVGRKGVRMRIDAVHQSVPKVSISKAG
jgi:hypothetical protein